MHENPPAELASEKIRRKLIECGGKATVYTLRGNSFEIELTESGKSFKTCKLPKDIYGFEVFDTIVDLLIENNGKAIKGCGRGKDNKLGQKKCELDTVVGAIAFRYRGNKIGDSVLDPVFALAAILEWAEICVNSRGFIYLK